MTQLSPIGTRSVIVLAALATIGFLTNCSRQHPTAEDGSRTITVSGHGSASAMPDKVEWRLLIHCDAPSIEAAHASALAANAALVARAKDLGLPDTVFQMRDLRQGANWEWVQGRRQPANSYYSELSQVLDLTDLAKYPAVTEKLFVDDAVVVEGVTFTSSKAEDLRRTALAKAIADARAKADFVARQLGVSTTGVRFANTMDQQGVIEDLAEVSTAQRPAASLPALKPITVNSMVTVTYDIK